MTVIFDHDAEGKTDLECMLYSPEEGDVIGNFSCVEIAISVGTKVSFKGKEFSDYNTFLGAFYRDLHDRGIK